jgi:hypothetical protein
VSQASEPLEKSHAGVADLRTGQVEVPESGQALHVDEPRVGHRRTIQPEDLEAGPPFEVNQGGIRDGDAVEIQVPEPGQLLQLRQAGVGHLGAVDDQCLQVVEPCGTGQLSIGASWAEEHMDDTAQDIDRDAIHDPSGPPGDAVGFPSAVHKLPLVQGPAPRAPKGRHRISSDASTAEQSAQPATDRQDQDHKPGHAEAQVAPPGAFDGRCHTTNIERGLPAVEELTDLVGPIPGLATFSVHLLREGLYPFHASAATGRPGDFLHSLVPTFS